MRTGTRARVLTVLAIAAVVVAGLVVVRVVSRSGGESRPAGAPARTPDSVPATSASVPAAPPAGQPSGFPDLAGLTDVSREHEVPGLYPLATFTGPSGLQCAMWSSRGDTAAFCFGSIPGLDYPANQVYAGDYGARFDQNVPPAADKLNGKPLAAGEKVVLGAGGALMGGDQITCGAFGEQVACELIRLFAQNHGGATEQRHGFVLDPQSSWTF